jgi:transcriptional regulator with XRE-family HTH domain
MDISGYIEGIDQKIRDRIKEVRKEKKISRRQLAEDLGMNLYTYTDLENGKINFDIKRLFAVLKYLDIHDVFQDKKPEGQSLQVITDFEGFIQQFQKMQGDFSGVKEDVEQMKNVLQQILDKLNEEKGDAE